MFWPHPDNIDHAQYLVADLTSSTMYQCVHEETLCDGSGVEKILQWCDYIGAGYVNVYWVYEHFKLFTKISKPDERINPKEHHSSDETLSSKCT